MKTRALALVALALLGSTTVLQAQDAKTDPWRTTYVRPSGDTEGVLYEPAEPGPKSRIGLVFSHPNRDNLDSVVAKELARRGYRALMINYMGDEDYARGLPEGYLPSISEGIAHLRSLPGIDKVILIAHSGGTHLGTLYTNVAEHGPAVCQGPEKIYKCPSENIEKLEKPDGLVLLDPTLGAAHNMSAIDPAALDEGDRDASLDMFAAENGFDKEGKKAKYAPEFAQRFYAAQAARNQGLVDQAVARMKLIETGEGGFANDEPLIVRGVGVGAAGARLYQPDLSIAAHSKKPHVLLKADGTQAEEIIKSVRPTSGGNVVGKFHELDLFNYVTTVRHFLADSAIRTTADYAFTEDDIVGVDWASSFTSTPSNAEGVSVPALVMNMTCHYLIVPGEIIFDHLHSADKSYAAVEGAAHSFKACKPEYGDTVKVTFDYVDGWLSKEGRF